MTLSTPRLIIGISGASGITYGITLLEALHNTPIETHLVISKAAHLTLASETTLTLNALQQKADVFYQPGDISAPIASGSFKTLGMVVAPCSIRTMSAIASGNTDTLLSRAADVALKERRKLVLMVRETPLHVGHLRSMVQLAEMGAIIAPPVPAFYNRPDNIQDIVNHTVGRVLDLFDIESGLVKRWAGM
jgi:4-hydroxy-3-polyprenylbenzoate decarboxylase